MNSRETVTEERVDGTPRCYISGDYVVAYDEENDAWHVIYVPRKRGQFAPYSADGSKSAPSFSHMMIF
jgi:hypothetical protein